MRIRLEMGEDYRMLSGDITYQGEVKPSRFSPKVLESFDRQRHILLSEARGLVKTDAGLPVERLDSAISGGDISVYHFGNEEYLDRLDVGRAYHNTKPKSGLRIERHFSRAGEDPFKLVGEYAPRDVIIKDDKDNVIFEMKGAVFPVSWNDTDVKMVAQKYLYKPGKAEWKKKLEEKLGQDHEKSPVQLFTRVSRFFGEEGMKLGYFATDEDKQAFIDELNALQATRRFAFNSPTYFNAGLWNEYGIPGSPATNFWRNPETGEVIRIKNGCNIRPQGHACFIRSPTDHLPRILEQAVDEGNIFSSGSGVGGDLSDIREEGAPLASGGRASGPISFMVAYDDGAGTIKSGGKSRRAARMQTLKYTHPDIRTWIVAKLKEDRKALALMKAGYSPGMDGEAYGTVTFQNTNFSVRVDDQFFDLVEKDGNVEFRKVVTGEVTGKYSARKLLQEIAFDAWRIGDPGLQYTSQIDEYHTCPNSGKINSSNPCGEYLFVNDTSCNLASANLVAFCDEKGKFDVKAYQKAVRIMAIAQDIANHACSYPIEDTARISPEFATIGQGFANLGTFLMRRSVAYDSDAGRATAAAVTAIMTGTAYETSAELADHLGSFVHYELNRKPMIDVLGKHRKNLESIAWEHVPDDMKSAAVQVWDSAIDGIERKGARNAQVTAIAPTGTISYIMGCDTTGGEPAVALAITKNLAGGGQLFLANREVSNALKNLGYSPQQVEEMSEHVAHRNTMVGAPHIRPEHVKVFATAMGNVQGEGAIPFEGHVRMVGALQPFVTGGFSKTNNLPTSAKVKDIYDGFILGHDLGLKGLTVFRNDSKPVSALGFSDRSYIELKRGEKEDLPTKRDAFEVELKMPDGKGGAIPFHMLVSEYEDGRPGQITFLSYSAGSTLKAILETHGILGSKALKRGVHLDDVAGCWIGQKFEPCGLTSGHDAVKEALSLLDAAGKILLVEYMGRLEFADNKKVDPNSLRGAKNGAFQTYAKMKIDDWDISQVLKHPDLGGFVERKKEEKEVPATGEAKNGKNGLSNTRGVLCVCGTIMNRTGSNCYECPNCPEKKGGCGG